MKKWVAYTEEMNKNVINTMRYAHVSNKEWMEWEKMRLEEKDLKCKIVERGLMIQLFVKE